MSYRYENEQPFRKAAEEEISSLYKVIDEANLTKTDLEHQIESLKEELSFLTRSYEEVGGAGGARLSPPKERTCEVVTPPNTGAGDSSLLTQACREKLVKDF